MTSPLLAFACLGVAGCYYATKGPFFMFFFDVPRRPQPQPHATCRTGRAIPELNFILQTKTFQSNSETAGCFQLFDSALLLRTRYMLLIIVPNEHDPRSTVASGVF